MPDDLDELIRGAMKTLDEGVPSGYFESLPNRTLARLEGSMQQGSSGQADTRGGKVAPPPMAEPDTSPVSRQPIMQQTKEEREEDSGLHDIRNLAQSTKQRLSKRSITSPPVPDDDLLAASSGAFKNIALPQPAKMVSLPSVEELPSKAEVAAAEKAAKRAARESAKDLKKAEAAAPSAAIETPAASVSASLPARSAFTLPSQQRKSNKGPIIAILGLGMAAAAGGVFYMQMETKQDSAAGSKSMAASDQAAAPAPASGAGSAAAEVIAQPTVTPVEAPAAAAPAPEPPKDEAAAGVSAQLATDNVEQAEAKADDDKAPAKNKKKPPKGKRVEKDAPAPKVEEKKAPEKVDVKKPEPTAKGGEGEPSFDALLKEAGVSDQKKETKPKLDKKSLNRDDFNKGISGSATKAKGCYKGNQGTVMMKLTIAPSGSVSKVTVTGDFAGKPEGSCVENAMKSATFPPWDGGPQSFTYSVLLSD